MRTVGIIALGLASSAVFLLLVLRRADVGQALDSLQAATLWQIILAAGVIQCVYLGQAVRWRTLVVSDRPVGQYFTLVLAGVGTNNLLPLRIGDLLRARWLASRESIPTGRALGSVFRDRASDVVGLMLILLATSPFVADSAWVSRLALAGFVLLAGVALVIAGAIWYTRRHPRQRRDSRSRVRALGRDLLDELSSALGRARIATALVLSVVVWSGWAASARLVCASLGIDVSATEILFVTAVMNLGVAIPSSPGFVGTYQWLAVSALGLVGVASDPALAFALVVQAVWFVPTTIVGGGLALREVRRNTLPQRPQRSSTSAEPDSQYSAEVGPE
jgi:glycosyltransferase 2 family protein